MRKCAHCSSGVEENSSFCTSCGKELPKQKKCIKCGEYLSEDCDWCIFCGAKQTIEVKEVKEENPIQQKKSKKVPLIISILLIVCLIGSGIFFFGRNKEQLIVERYADSIRVADSIAAIEVYNAKQATAAENDGVICPEPRCGGIEVTSVSVVASNTLANQGSNSYHASNLLDNDYNTAWATHFTGNEETLTFRMSANRLYKFSLVNGYNKSEETFNNNSRAKVIKIYINKTLASQEELTGEERHWPEWVTLDREYNDVREVRIVISSVFQGNKWNDLCISNVNFYTKE